MVRARVTLSADDLTCVAGGLDEFSRTPMLMALTRRYNFVDGTGSMGGVGGSGTGPGGMTDMFSLLEGGPGAGSTSTGNGGTGAHGGSTLPNMTGTPSGGATGPYGTGVETGSGGAGAGSHGFGGGILGSLGSSVGAGSVATGGPGGAGAGPGGANSPLNAIFGLHASNPGSFGPGGVGTPGGTGPGGYGPGGMGPVGWNGANANGGDLSPYASSFIGTNTPGGGFGVGGVPSGSLGATMVTNSFEIRNWGDPHVNITINGQAMDQIDVTPSIDNFQVMNNTIGGATHISTETTSQEVGAVAFNKEIDIQGGSWALAATNADQDGDVDVSIQTAYGNQVLEVGQSMQQVDGTIITNQGDKLIVTQRLQDGGFVNTEISVNGSEYLDMKSTGQGNAGLGGYVFDQFAQGHQVQQNTTQASTGNLQQMLAARGWNS